MDYIVKEFVKGRDRLFESVFDLSVINESFYCHLFSGDEKVCPKPGNSIIIMPLWCDRAVTLPVSTNFPLVTMTNQTTSIILNILPRPEIPNKGMPPEDADSVPMHRFLTRLSGPIFLRFYETYSNWWIKEFNRDPHTWPDIMRFCRVIRNAVSHRSQIDWASSNQKSVEWNGLKYSHLDNEKVILGVDLSTADILLLMIDLSDELDRLGCPI